MKYWTFKVFINDGGNDTFEKWLKKQSKIAIATIRNIIDVLEITPSLGPPHVKQYKGHPHIWEIKAKDKDKQYRCFGCFGPKDTGKEFTILVGSTKQGKGKFKPPDVIETAKSRRKLIIEDGRYTNEYRKSQEADN